MSTEIEMRMVPIIGPRDEVVAAIRAGVRNGTIADQIDNVVWQDMGAGKVAVTVPMLRRIERPAPAPARREQSVSSAILSALAWVFGLAVIAFLLIAIAAALIGARTMLAYGVVVVAGALILMFLGNRSRHSGGCPGVAVHCKGCKR